MSEASSPVGATRSSCAALPPRKGDFSSKVTLTPRVARSLAALIPAIPPPITTACLFASTRMGSSGCNCFALAEAAATSRAALSVALSP